MAGLDFTYLKEFQIPLIPFNINKDVALSILELPLNPYIHFDNTVLESNFRLVESYMPELLYLISNQNDGNKSIADCINSLSKRKLFKSNKYANIYLRVKMYYWLEAILFTDIFSGRWDGKWEMYRCYVMKKDGELQYYQLYRSRQLVIMLLDMMTIKVSEFNIKLGFV